ncbi:MAG TPA: hypothetical protein VF178_13430 [Gemmatimonadaceae bacterium]
MDKFTAIVAITALITGAVTLTMLFQAIATIASRRRGKELPDAAVARLEDRLERIEQAVDAVAVEVERLSEAQRFQSKLLADRATERTGGAA